MMRSKTSFCNKKLLAIELKSQIPAMITMLIMFFGFAFIPEVLRLINDNETEVQVMTSYAIRDVVEILTNPVLIGVICICLAVIIFNYGYKKRASFMLHSFPVSRLEYFGTFTMAGLISMIATILVCYLSL